MALTATLTISTIGTQAANVAFTVTGTYTLNETTWTDQLVYEDNTGAQVPIASPAVTLGVSSWTYTHAGNLAPGTHTVTVKDPLTGTTATSNAFTVTAGKAVTVGAVTNAVAGAAFTFTGTLTGYASAPTLQYQLTGPHVGTSAPVTTGAVTGVTATGWSMPFTIAAAGNYSVLVTDGTNASPTVAFNVAAATVNHVITPTVPSSVPAGSAFTYSGTLSGYATIPSLTYALNNNAPATVTGVTLSGWSMQVIAPTTTGASTLATSDGSQTVASNFTVTAAAKVITPVAPSGAVAAQSFTFTGVLSGYTTIPALSYTILPGGSAVAMTGVSTTGWAMTVTVAAAGNYSVTVTDGTVTSQAVAFTVAAATSPSVLRSFVQNPGMDGSFWVQPFQNSSNWISSSVDDRIVALRGGTPTINITGNYSPPWYMGQATDPSVTVTDGNHTIVVHIPLGAVIEAPASPTDQSIGGVDASQPYLIWSISGATMTNAAGQTISAVQATGTVIKGTYGFAVQDGAGLMMVDAVTGAPGDNNSFGNIQSYELQQLTNNPNYVIQHMLAFQLDVSFQASSAGPIWPLLITDTSSGGSSTPYAGPIPQGVTVGIPASVARPLNQTRGYYGLWDCFQQFGGFNYNFGEVGGINLQVYDASGQYTAMVNQLVAAWPAVAQQLCILNYANGVSGAQYSLATTKGAIAGSTNAFAAPPPLDLSPTSGKNVAPSTFGAWYPSGYNVTPTNSTTGVTYVISPNTPTNIVAGTPFSFTGSLSGYTTVPTLTYSINGAAPVALTGVTTTGWSALITVTTPGAATIVVTDAQHAVNGSTGFSVTSTGTTATPVTWNTADTAGAITLSNGNYTATAGGSATAYGSPQGVRATAPLSTTQITVWEVVFGAITQNASVGVSDHVHSLTTTGGMGSDIDSLGAYPSTGTGSQPAQTVYNNNNQLTSGNGTASVAGAAISCAANGANFYFSDAAMRSTSGVQWNNSATADPVKNVGGLSFTGIGSPYYPTFEAGEGGSVATLNDGTTAFSAFLATYVAANPSVVSLSGQAATAPSKAITPNVPAGVVVGAAFTFTGSLTGYTSVPTLTYALNGASPVALSGVTVSGWSSTLLSQVTGSNTIVVTDGTVSNQVSFTVAAAGGGTAGNKVAAPLTGTVTKGTWTVNVRQNLANSPSGLGYMQYNVLPPAQYNSSLTYPVLFVGHPNDNGMNGSSYPKDGTSFVTGAAYGASFSLDTMYNTVAFRTAHPCFVVAVQVDQTLDLSGANANANGGGYADSQNSGWNENAENAVFATVVSTYPIDRTQCYHIGYSLGGIQTLAQLVDNNVYNGPSGLKQWTAGATFSDQLYRPNTPNSSVFARMSSVPLACFSTDSDNVPSSYDQPAWQSYAGNSNYPTQSAYDSGGMAAIRAGTTNYYYVNYGSSNPATTFMPMNADGGDGTAMYAWLFSQTSGGATGPSITGVAFTASSPVANSPVGTVAGTLTAASSNGALTTITFTLNTTTNFKVTGSNVVFNSATVAGGTYPLTVTVAATNATNTPQSYSISVVVAGAGGGSGIFRVSGGKILSPGGAVVAPVGINVNNDQLTSANANSTTLLANFPGLSILRVPFHAYSSAASMQTAFAQLTAANIICVVEDHTSIGQQPYTGSQLTSQLAFYTDFATTYKTNPYVWFGTQNEAYPLTSNNGDDVTSSHIAIYNAIRSAGNTSPVMLCEQGGGNPNELPGGSGPQLTASRYATLTNVIWDFHFYNWTTGYSGVQATIQSDFTGFIAQCQSIQSGDGVVPVIVGEYGTSTTGNTPDDVGGTLLVNVVGASGLGSMAWAWNAGGSSDNLTGGTAGVGGGALTAYGMQVAANIAAASGVVTPPPASAETANNTLVTVAGTNIIASDTPGTAGSENTISFTTGGTIVVNGAVAGGTNVVALYYTDHTCYQQNSDGNWYAPITAGTFIPVSHQITDLQSIFGTVPNTVLYRGGFSGANQASQITQCLAAGIIPIGSAVTYVDYSQTTETASFNAAYASAQAIVQAFPNCPIWEVGNEYENNLPKGNSPSGDETLASSWTGMPCYPILRGSCAGAIAAIRTTNPSALIIGGAGGGYTHIGLALALAANMETYVEPGATASTNLLWDYTCEHWYNDVNNGFSLMGNPANFAGGYDLYTLMNPIGKPWLNTEIGSGTNGNASFETAAGDELATMMGWFSANSAKTATQPGFVGGNIYELYQNASEFYYLFNKNGIVTTESGQGPPVKAWIAANPSPTFTLPANTSGNGTVITTVGPAIIDSYGHSWTITSGAQLALNGVAVSFTSAVKTLAYANAVLWQENTAGNWYSLVVINGAAVTSAGPTTTPLPAKATPLVTLANLLSPGNWLWGINGHNDQFDGVYAGGGGNTGSAVASPIPSTAATPAALNGLGYTAVFFDDFTIDKMSPNLTATTGYNWYQGTNYAGGQQNSPTNYNVMTTATAASISNGNTSGGAFASASGGILQINGIAGMTYNGNWQTIPQSDSSTTGAGKWNHGYFEAYVQFKDGGASTTGGWPAWWSWSNPGSSGNAVEIDIMEYDAQNQPGGYMAWTVSDPGGGVKTVSPGQPATRIAITDSQWHVYACWWRGNGTTGTLDFYYDGAHIGPQMTTGQNGQVPDLESNANLFLTLGCGPGWPQYVDWVRVWRLPGT